MVKRIEQVLIAARQPWRQLLPGAAVGAVCWSVLQALGSYVVSRQLARANLVYGLEVANVDRADVYVDGRPRGSVDVAAGRATVTVEGVAGAASLRVEGFSDGKLVAAQTLEL